MDPSIHPILLWLLLGFSRSEKQAEPSFLLPLDSFKLFICLTVFFFLPRWYQGNSQTCQHWNDHTFLISGVQIEGLDASLEAVSPVICLAPPSCLVFSVWKQDSHMYQNFFTGEAEPGSEMTLLYLNPNSLEIKGLCFVSCGLGARIRSRSGCMAWQPLLWKLVLCLNISSQLVATFWEVIEPLEGEPRL